MKAVSLLNILSRIFLCASAGLITYVIYLAFIFLPHEKQMGPVQRIFYFHVGAATACYLSLAILFVAGLFYLSKREALSDALGEAAAEVAFMLATIVLASGMIWGHSAWNTWFSWEPRLVSFLILWLMLLAYLVLRQFGDPARVPSHCSVLGILCAVNVPIVVYSVKLLPHLIQLHPQVVEKEGLHPLFKSAMFWGMGALACFQFCLVCFRTRIGLLERAVNNKE